MARLDSTAESFRRLGKVVIRQKGLEWLYLTSVFVTRFCGNCGREESMSTYC